MSVTTGEITIELKRLAAVYKPPAADPDQVARIWCDACEGISAAEFAAAVRAYVKSPARYFPRPADIREIVAGSRKDGNVTPGDLKGRYNRWASAGDHATEPCPVCGAILQKLGDHWGVSQGDHGRFGVLHDKRQHDAARVPHTGYPYDREYVEGCNTRLAEQRKQGAA